MPLTDEELNSAHSQSIGRLFLQAQRDFQARVMQKLQQDGGDTISPAHLTTLSQLSRGNLRVVDLAETMKITKQSASALIHDLEVQGFVMRQPDPRDKRAALISLTPSGEVFLRDKLQIAPEIDREYVALIGQDGFDHLVALLTQIVENQPGD